MESLATIAIWTTPSIERSICKIADVTNEEDVILHSITCAETPAKCRLESISLEPALAVPERERVDKSSLRRVKLSKC